MRRMLEDLSQVEQELQQWERVDALMEIRKGRHNFTDIMEGSLEGDNYERENEII